MAPASMVRGSDSVADSGWRSRCLEVDSPGRRPLPSHWMGASIRGAGLKAPAERAGGAELAARADLGNSSSAAPPYLESDSPGRTKGAGAWPARAGGAASLPSGEAGAVAPFKVGASAGIPVDHPGDEDLSPGT